ncbi:branched-chain amino acid transporter AzlD [Leucobacter sp. UCD-THU]|jgi:branched-subunit amino acid transport protein AzlD|uniref:branched-chain amino acid transporter permease n=1 Tax=Leucobacter sp. UCD-THU TaxID=1292023 RepID=UPI0003717204|nr:AzlD domain-containing protein [Leucobacter sp. UCD-THU]EYT53177.1 branched-chain amino acid transporter AzlD [Leucobacter sp. UCD-THU]
MPDAPLWYLIAAIAIGGLITLALRAVPFAVLKPLRKSKLVQRLGRWMPAGLLLILVVVVLRGEVLARPGEVWAIAAASAVTVVVHLLGRRRALLSIAAGTACYVLLLNLF